MTIQSWKLKSKLPIHNARRNRNGEPSRVWLLTLAAFVLIVVTSAVAKADISPFLLVTQDMTSAQQDELYGLGLLADPDASSTITFSSVENLQAMSFSFVALPGSTYNGLSLTLIGSGAFDSAQNLWEWSFSGSLGSNTLTGSGSESGFSAVRVPGFETKTKGQETETDKQGRDHTRYWADKKTYDDKGKFTAGTIWPTDKDGTKTGDEKEVKGQVNNDGKYNKWNLSGPPFDIATSGFASPNGPGYFVTTVSATPEPSSLLLLGSGVLGLSGFLRQRLLTRR
jgi:hypothetical protein